MLFKLLPIIRIAEIFRKGFLLIPTRKLPTPHSGRGRNLSGGLPDRREGPSGSEAQLRRLRAILSLFTLILFLALPLQGWGLEPLPDPPESSPPTLFSLGIEVYRKNLSPVLDSNCYMHPSCSAYSKQAFAQYGPFLGLLLTVDRLFHEPNEDQTSPLIRQGTQVKIYDPPSANVWWKKKPGPQGRPNPF